MPLPVSRASLMYDRVVTQLDGRTSEMLLHGSSIVLRMAMEHSDEYER